VSQNRAAVHRPEDSKIIRARRYVVALQRAVDHGLGKARIEIARRALRDQDQGVARRPEVPPVRLPQFAAPRIGAGESGPPVVARPGRTASAANATVLLSANVIRLTLFYLLLIIDTAVIVAHDIQLHILTKISRLNRHTSGEVIHGRFL
jgi:hypothetical protein